MMQRSYLGEPQPMNKAMAFEVLHLWKKGPTTYNEVKLMSTMIFITPELSFPDPKWSNKMYSPHQLGLRQKLRPITDGGIPYMYHGATVCKLLHVPKVGPATKTAGDLPSKVSWSEYGHPSLAGSS
jgi:hypothetical protein